MKKIVAVLAVGLLLGVSNMALAQDTSVTVGVKMWYVEFELEDIKSDNELMYGPAINIRHENFFAGVSYLMGDFTFTNNDDYYYEEEFKVDRTDLDLSIGYYVHSNVALFLGYKKSEFEGVYTEQWEGIEEKFEWEFKGPAIGVTGHYPIGDSRACLFGTLSYVWLDGELDGESREDFTGPAIEFGVAYGVETVPVSVSLAYKYQKYEEDKSGGHEETFRGLTAGVNYTF